MDHPSGPAGELAPPRPDLRPVDEVIYRIGVSLSAELNLDRIVQLLTDEATALCGAQSGAFFYNVTDASGQSYTLYTLSGAEREPFEKIGMPRNTALFEPTFAGTAVVRLADVTLDPRYGKNAPHHGMPEGHLPVKSYLAVPVKSRAGEVLGGLFLGHAEAGVFTERDERALVGIAAQAGIAIDNARLYQKAVDAEEAVKKSLASEQRAREEAERERTRIAALLIKERAAREALRETEQRFRLAAEAAAVGIFDYEPLSGALTWDARCRELFGLPEGAPVSYDVFLAGLHPDDRARTDEAVRRGLDPEQRSEFAIEYRTVSFKDGVERWIAARGRAFFDETMRAVRFTGTVLDITERKRTERDREALIEALKRSARELGESEERERAARRAAEALAADIAQQSRALEQRFKEMRAEHERALARIAELEAQR